MPPGKAKARVAVVEGDPHQRQRLVSGLTLDHDHTVFEASDPEGALRLLKEHAPDILLLDLDLPGGGLPDGVGLIRGIEESGLDTVTIVMSGDLQKRAALRVLAAGAYDYFTKPVDLDVLRVIIDRAAERQRIVRENRILRDEVLRQGSFGDLVGASASMRAVYDAIRRVADSNASVIIRGESGTGKELVALSIHQHSRRAKGPFVSVNCGALPEGLMEAELFGYEKGAFTGAVSTKEGRFELAHGGTLFLDEVGSLTLPLQAKLLRVLEEREFVRLGGKRSVKVDIRVVTATNEDLEDKVSRRRFRPDLYYRIQVVPIRVPPLRERLEDIRLLAGYFLEVYCAANGVPPKRFDEEAMRGLEAYGWPGNVRELQNVVQRMVLMTPAGVIGFAHLPESLIGEGPPAPGAGVRLPPRGVDLVREMKGHEKLWLTAALARSRGVKVEAGRLLGLSKDQMKYLCRKHRL
jgi:two-component system NtrC family response regulator